VTRNLTATATQRALGIDSVQLRRWVREGRITEFRAATGHRRYLESEVRSLRDAQ
jgi:predicted site-specific integrase-resolvase